ncbi:hypothetical protein TNCV_3159221 [Trichonephila clavipes]|nr:hypothetical protein TNCV_3159221 [Trichonephila clavipes]
MYVITFLCSGRHRCGGEDPERELFCPEAGLSGPRGLLPYPLPPGKGLPPSSHSRQTGQRPGTSFRRQSVCPGAVRQLRRVPVGSEIRQRVWLHLLRHPSLPTHLSGQHVRLSMSTRIHGDTLASDRVTGVNSSDSSSSLSVLLWSKATISASDRAPHRAMSVPRQTSNLVLEELGSALNSVSVSSTSTRFYEGKPDFLKQL